MLPVDDAYGYFEQLVAAGLTQRDDIHAKLRERFGSDLELDELIDHRIDKLISLLIAKGRDATGDRVTFASRDEDGHRIIVDLRYCTDSRAMRRTGRRLRRTGESMIRAGDRLIERAEQLDLFTGAAT